MKRLQNIWKWLQPGALLRLSVLAVLCLLGFSEVAHARCGLPDGVMLLVDDLYAATQPGMSADPKLAARIQQNMRGVDMRDVSSKLFSVGLAHRRARIEALLTEAQRVSALGRTASPNLLREQLNSVERLHNAVCKLEEIKADELAKAKATSQPSGPPRTFENLGTTARIAILLGLTSFISGMLIVGRNLYHWVHALISARRSCRIAAALERGLDVVDGTVTVLGRKGCRFQPVNPGAYDRAAAMVDKPGLFLVVDGKRHLLGSGIAQGFFVTVFFLSPLQRNEQADLLALSSVTPRIAPKSRQEKKQRKAKAAQPLSAAPKRFAVARK